MNVSRAQMRRLRDAYLRTDYVVESPRAVIRVGATNRRLDAWLERAGHRNWAFITAWNPRSTPLRRAANEARQRRLVAELRKRGLSFRRGIGRPHARGWTAEPSLLVLGIPAREALALASRFDQHAILTGVRGRAARLRFVRDGRQTPYTRASR